MRLATLILVLCLFGLGGESARAERIAAEPQRVNVLGWVGDVMEPFLSRDGNVLFFNNRLSPPTLTDLHWAVRLDDLNFLYVAPVHGANDATLDAVATMSVDGSFCFVSARSYATTLSSVYCGLFVDGLVLNPVLQRRVSLRTFGRAMFDVETSADGMEMLLADGHFQGKPLPVAADLRMATWRGDQYVLAPEFDPLFAAVNSDELEYGSAISADGLTLAFTRLRATLPRFANASIWVARRTARDQPFGAPRQLRAITGFAEAPTFAPDGVTIYFHRLEGDRFTLWRISAN